MKYKFYFLLSIIILFLAGCHRPEPNVTITELDKEFWSYPDLNTNIEENQLYRIDSTRQLQDLFLFGTQLSDVDILSDIDFNEHTLLFFLSSWNNHDLDIIWEKMDDKNYNLKAELWETAAPASHQIFYVCITNRKLRNNEYVSFSIIQHDIPYEE